uniref:Ribonuclease A-domain domain-containing protein n=1 Tax=Bos indicus x Bos taurus TaxID=30522 RepID=A0A4W2I1Z1_BOBOX
MALKSLVVLPLLVLVLLLVRVQPSLGKESAAAKFERQHMDSGNSPSSSSNYCNLMMCCRKMTQGKCKPVNTFVHESLADVKAVCSQKKVTCKNGQTNCYQSKSTMRITDCRETGSSKYPNCAYKTTQAVCSQKNVACKNGQTNCYQSYSTMSITDCRETGSSKYPNCAYKTTQANKHIIVACEGNPYVPVHFDASV